MNNDQITVLMVEPGKPPYPKEIASGLSSLQHEVGGYIEATYPSSVDPVAIICNETGKIDQLPFNRGLRDENGELYDFIMGNFMVVGLGEDNFTSLPQEYIEKYSQIFVQPELLGIVDGALTVMPDMSDDETAFSYFEL